MDIAQSLSTNPTTQPIKCIDMHTTGEPTRIIYSGFPALQGTLLEQRDQAMTEYDHIRKRLMLEPRGHNDMYGAIIRPDTELVASGEAHVGTLFTHNGGFSTMCGHATIALGRFLVDTHDSDVFPRRDALVVDGGLKTVDLNLHAPCGLVRVRVPVTNDGRKSDSSRPVTFLSTPAFATAVQLNVPVPGSAEIRWPELGERESITLDVSYGGAFYAIVTAQELGFAQGLKNVDLEAVSRCIQKLKPYLASRPEIAAAVKHPEDSRLSFLYSVMIMDPTIGAKSDDVAGAETGLCYFADDQIDRSPTGSCVSARMALAHAKGLRPLGQRWAYNSLVSNAFGAGMFNAGIVEEGSAGVVVEVEGQAYYVGTSTFVVEEGDAISSSGFTLKDMRG